MTSLKLEVVTPELASKWLDEAPKRADGSYVNRTINEQRVDGYARSMKRDSWSPLVGKILFGEAGDLLGGYHTLSAIAKSGVTLEVPVVYNATEQDFMNEGVGRNQTLKDRLKHKDVTYYVESSQLAKLLYSLDVEGEYNFGNNKVLPSQLELMELVLNETLREEACVYMKAVKNDKLPVKSGPVGLAYIVFHRENTEKADEFFYGFRTGANLPEDSPVFRVREFFVKNYDKKMNEYRQFYFLSDAWKKFLAGESCPRRINFVKDALYTKASIN